MGKGKRVCECNGGKGKKARTETNQRLEQSKLFASTRKQIAKWQRQQSSELRDLLEHKHFEVRVDLGSDDECIPFVRCLLCNNKCLLGSKKGSILLSNWTRHVSKCIGFVKN